MHAEIVDQRIVKLPPYLRNISNEKEWWDYLASVRDKGEISRRIVEPFQGSLYTLTGFDDYSPPDEDVEFPVNIGDFSFVVKVKPTTKTPAYSVVYNELLGMLKKYLEDYETDKRVEDIVKIENEPYISIGLVLERINNYSRKVMRGKEGVSRIVQIVTELEIPEMLSIVYGRYYSELNEDNARDYILSKNIIKEIERRTNSYEEDGRRIDCFMGLLRNHALGVLGGMPDAPKCLRYPMEETIFLVNIEPRERCSYKSVIDKLIKPVGERITRRSSIGDLIKAKEVALESETGRKILERGLVDEEFRRTYNPRRRSERVFVRLKGLTEALEMHKRNATTLYTELNIRVEGKK